LEETTSDQPQEDNKSIKSPTSSAPKRVLADGTYASESAFSFKSVGQTKLDALKAAAKPPLRSLILGGDYYVGASLSSALTKLALRYSQLSKSPQAVNAFRSEAMLIMTSIIRVGKSDYPKDMIDEDSHERISNCLKVLSGILFHELNQVFLHDTRKAFSELIKVDQKHNKEPKSSAKVVKVQADDLLIFRQLKSKKGGYDSIDEVGLYQLI
jgi:coatomer subunit beta